MKKWKKKLEGYIYEELVKIYREDCLNNSIELLTLSKSRFDSFTNLIEEFDLEKTLIYRNLLVKFNAIGNVDDILNNCVDIINRIRVLHGNRKINENLRKEQYEKLEDQYDKLKRSNIKWNGL